MRWTIARKLFLALLVVCVAFLGMSTLVSRWSFERGFFAYVSAQEAAVFTGIAENLAAYYGRHQSWHELMDDPGRWHRVLRDAAQNTRGGPRTREGRPPPPRGDRGREPTGPLQSRPNAADPLRMADRVALYTLEGQRIAGSRLAMADWTSAMIDFEGQEVAELRLTRAMQLTADVDIQFAQSQTRSMLVAGIVLVLLAVLASLVIARQLTRPIQTVAAGAPKMAQGNYEERIPVTSNDELGELAGDFNTLAKTLARNQLARRQWLADVNHELRTPLAIMSGELNALEDGLRQYNDGVRRSLQAEVHRVTSLIDDLHELSVSDEGALDYQRSEVDLVDLVSQLLDSYAHRTEVEGLVLRRDMVAKPIWVLVDPQRFEQLFCNLLENSLRYTTVPGEMLVAIKQDADAVLLEVSDSAPGVPVEVLPRIFERLFRVERSRNRATGGSGLGLAICKAIVEAHDGEITAAPSPMGGLSVMVRLPLVKSNMAGRGVE